MIAFEVEAGALIDKPTLGTDRFTYSGNEVVVTDYLSSFAHMTATGTDRATNVGDYQFAVTPASGYEWSDNSGTVAVPFAWSIAAKPIQGNITVPAIPAQTYTGSPITPEFEVRDTARNVVLTLGTDYTAEYIGNVNIGTATIKLTGIGNYTATENTTFQIVANANEQGYYVTPDADGSGDGLGWETPTTLASALTKAQSATKPVAIYMKEGTYAISSACSLSSPGQDVKIMGGYTGVGLARSQNFSVLNGGGSSGFLSLNTSNKITLQQLRFTNGNAGDLVRKSGSGAMTVEHCLFDNTRGTTAITVAGGQTTVENCTFYKNDQMSIAIIGSGAATVRNTIMWRFGSSQEIAGTATLEYVLLSGTGTSTGKIIYGDPKFVDADHGDFHLQSTAGHYTSSGWVTDSASSPAIDAGDPTADCSAEPKNSAGQNFGLNLGVYGNTAQASMSPVRATVTVTLDKGEGSGGTESVKGLEGTAMPAVSVPTRENYNFMGYFTATAGGGTKYYDEDGQPVGSPVFSTSVTTLYANWEENIHYIARPTQDTSSWTYDGQDHRPTTYAETDGYTVAYSAAAPWKNVNTYTITFTLKNNWRWNSGTDTSSPIVFTYTITQREVTLNWGSTSLMYNKTAQAPTCTAGNLVSDASCTVTVSGQQTNVGTGYTATAASVNNANYKLPSEKTTTFSIAKKALTVTGLSATSRPYDGTTTVAIAGGTLNGVISGDTVTCEMPRSGTIADANVGTGKPVTYPALTLGGSSAGNYSVTSPSLTVNITEASITAVTLTSTSETYDGQPHQPQVASVTTANGKSFTSASTGWDVSYSRNDFTSVGTITVTVTGTKNLTGSASTTFTITGPTVTLNKCGGVEGTGSVEATPGSDMPTIVPPFRNGYSFKGYFTQEGGAGVKYYNADGTSARTYPASDFPTTLYANWEFV